MTKINNFKIGLFFIVGLIIGLGALFWIGATDLFTSQRTYTTFFNTSVGGLGVGAEVQYLGLSVGKISKISLVPDRHLVEVSMAIRSGFEVDKKMAVELKLAGITGKRYLDIVELSDSSRGFVPKDHPKVQSPVLPSVRGQFARVESALEKMYGKIQSIDFEKFVRQWEKVAENANSVLASRQIDTTLQNLAEVSRRLETVTSSLGKPGAAKQWDQTFNNLAATAESAKAVTRSLENQVEKVPPGSIAEMTKQMNATLKRIESATRSTDAQVNDSLALFQQTLQQTSQVLSEFKLLARSLRQEPGRILTQPENQEPFER